jgi:signal transduction histidine kinase
MNAGDRRVVDRVLMRSAFDRVVRTLIFSTGVGTLVFTLLGLPVIIEQFAYLNPVYSTTAMAVYCGLPLVLACVAFQAPIRWLRALAGVHVSATVLFLLLWVPAMTVDVLPGGQLPWMVNIIAVATSMGAIALPFFGAWIYLFAMATLSGFVRYVTYGGGDASIAFQDSVMIVLISGFMMALLQLTLRAGREQDAAALLAQNAAAETAANETLERQRTRYHAFTHDDVLATLLAASHDGARPSDVTRRSAQRTLEKMDQFRLDLPVPSFLTVAELEAHLRTAAKSAAVPLRSSLTASGTGDVRIPVEVADALTEALTEAMRNSVRHSVWSDGRPVHREATATIRDSTISIVVTDDGRGFNPGRVGIDRLGVRLSILQRVNSQPGGHASVRSSKGAGTTVILTWRAPDAD